MENTLKGPNKQFSDPNEWSKEDSEKLILNYLEDYYQTLDEYFLKEAFQIAKDEGIDIQKIMRQAKSQMH